MAQNERRSIPAQVRDWFSQTSVGRDMLTEIDRDRDMHERRKAAEMALVALDEEEARDIPPLAKARDDAFAEWQAYRQAERDAEKRYRAASLSEMSRKTTIDNARAKNQTFLRETAPVPVLRPFQDRIDAEIERLSRRDAREVRREMMEVGYNLRSGPIRQVVERDNTEMIKSRVERLVKARSEGARLCETRADITASELETLLDDLPDYHLT